MSALDSMTSLRQLSGSNIPYNGEQARKIFGHSREADWAIGGAALGFTAALVEYIANNVFVKDINNQFASRKGELRVEPKKSRRRRKFKDILEDTEDLSQAFGYDDYDISYRNLLQEHYLENDDVYDYEDYHYTQFFRTTYPPKTYEMKYDLKKLNTNTVSTTRSPFRRRKSSTTTVKPRRKPKHSRKLSTVSPISEENFHSKPLLDKSSRQVISDSSSSPNVASKLRKTKGSEDKFQRRYFNQVPQQADFLRRATSEYDRQKMLEKQQVMFNRIMAYTSQNYNQKKKKYEPPINAYVGNDPM